MGRVGLALSLFLLLATAEAPAGHLFHRREGTPPPGVSRQFPHTHARAGDPLCVSAHAVPTNGPAYGGYYVGGGSACHGCDRRAEEGTWGWDYEGVHLPRRVRLAWGHGRRAQGGTGAYATDRP